MYYVVMAIISGYLSYLCFYACDVSACSVKCNVECLYHGVFPWVRKGNGGVVVVVARTN
jgi:hypothetical protein